MPNLHPRLAWHDRGRDGPLIYPDGGEDVQPHITALYRLGSQSYKCRVYSVLCSVPSGRNWRLKSSTAKDTLAFGGEKQAIGRELHEQAAFHKILYINNSSRGKAIGADDPNGWELFNVPSDPGETKDLSTREPDTELLEDWDTYVKETGSVWGPDAMEPGLSKEEAPHLHDVDLELHRTWLQTPSGSRPVC